MATVIKKGRTTTYDFSNGKSGKIERFPEIDGTVRGRGEREEVRRDLLDLMQGPIRRVFQIGQRLYGILENLYAPHERAVLVEQTRIAAGVTYGALLE